MVKTLTDIASVFVVVCALMAVISYTIRRGGEDDDERK